MYQEIIQLQTIASMKTPTYQSLTLMVNTITHGYFYLGVKYNFIFLL